MFFALKVIISSILIVFITEIAKKYAILGGFIAVLPVNIVFSLAWIYLEKKDMVVISNFTYSALLGIFPTIMFLVIILFLFNKNNSFLNTLLMGFGVLFVAALVQYKLFKVI